MSERNPVLDSGFTVIPKGDGYRIRYLFGRSPRIPWWPNVPLALATLLWPALLIAAIVIALIVVSGRSEPVSGEATGAVSEVREDESSATSPAEMRASEAAASSRTIVDRSVESVAGSRRSLSSIPSIRVRAGEPTTAESLYAVAVRPEPPARDVRAIIRRAAAIWGADGDLMVRIAHCESTLRPHAVNPSGDATGLFQHISSTWIANVRRMGVDYTLEDRKNPGASANVAAWMIAGGNIGAWDESRGCWG